MSQKAGRWRGGLVFVRLLSAAAVVGLFAAGADFNRWVVLETVDLIEARPDLTLSG